MDRAEPVRPRRIAEAGWRGAMTRQCARQPIEKRRVLRDVIAAVQEEQRRTRAGDRAIERVVSDFDLSHSLSSRHCGASVKVAPTSIAILGAVVHPR